MVDIVKPAIFSALDFLHEHIFWVVFYICHIVLFLRVVTVGFLLFGICPYTFSLLKEHVGATMVCCSKLYGFGSALVVQFVPHLFCVAFLGYIVEVTCLVHCPATKDAETVLVPFTLTFTFPDHVVACCETDASLCIEVYTNGIFFLVFDDGKDVSILQFLHLCASEVIAVGDILYVSTNDWGRNAHDLLAFRVKLEERLSTKLLADLVAFQMSNDRLSCKKVLALALVEHFKVILVKLGIEEYIDTTFFRSNKTESGSCLYFFTIVCRDMYRQDW